ncbi:MAG: GAF domain-containing sensor histidine kinase [Actinomycetota bacterium]|nr:GAF domain-containing sensor histidine kinase [Actinomycetota bacterium]
MVLRQFTPARLRDLVEGAAAVAGQTDLQAILATTVEIAMDLTGAPHAALGVVGQHGGLVDFVHAGLDPVTAETIGAPPQGRGLLGLISRDGETVRVDDLSDHPASIGMPSHHPQMGSFLGVPVRAGPNLFGNLYLTDKEDGFTEEDEALVEALAMIAGTAIRTVRLQQRLQSLAVAEDRERIARDLHDAIIQDLFAVGLSLQGQALKVVDPEIRRALEQDVESLDRTITSLRGFIFDLGAPAGGQRTLRSELRELVTRLAGPHDTEVHVAYTGSLDALPQHVIDDATQLVRESLSNSLRHSSADRVTIEIHGGDDRLALRISDNGVGFDPAEVAWGLGLTNLRERATRAGGQISIDSTAESGTAVRASLPL